MISMESNSLCPTCRGTGQVAIENTIASDRAWTELCVHCNGVGLLLRPLGHIACATYMMEQHGIGVCEWGVCEDEKVEQSWERAAQAVASEAIIRERPRWTQEDKTKWAYQDCALRLTKAECDLLKLKTSVEAFFKAYQDPEVPELFQLDRELSAMSEALK